MRILLLNHFPISGSGSGIYTANIAKSLRKKGHDVCIINPENNKNYKKLEGIIQKPVFFNYKQVVEDSLPFNFPCFTTHPTSTLKFNDLTKEQEEMYKTAFLKKLDEVIKAFNPDIIHCGHIWILSSLSCKYNIPVIITSHGTDLLGFKESKRFRKYAYDAFHKSHCIIAISKENQHTIHTLFKKAKKKTILMQNGYNPNIFYIKKQDENEILKHFNIKNIYDKIVLYVGKLTYIKGVDILLKAAKTYEEENILSLIVGNGELQDQLIIQKDQFHLKNVYFLGNQPQDILNKLYNIADVSVVPSRSEAFGFVALEAMACGTIVVASDVGGLHDLITKETGILVPKEDDKALANAIIHVLNNKEKFNSSIISQYVKNKYSQDIMIESLIELYHKYI